MDRRLDPPHERVWLSGRELASLEQLERTFAASDAAWRERHEATLQRAVSFRFRLLVHRLGASRSGPVAIVVGVVLLVVALPVSVFLSAIGAVVTVLGVASTLRRPWRRLVVRLQRTGDR